ncbi:L-rhamnose mutarotase [Halomonas elongata]|uniref:L-rhamnose mutarotase n=2 Tax=Halomonas elongata TaxID=2746 RepID=E1VAZ6_HALED|nr:L-rhamnose mutarotase [Halomonas elongata]MBW5801851.1 L-rhamnose mutarotase [Halomonas elongata]RAW08117.1 L-rhamnose mutarotase [Halomonas elongata]WBF17861.1 L-rhamnose mutarotase [Halomonas elongata]WPU46706.1 L-rhamnose mutarotase [Halomonas elongata DSM 2581]WVI71425.1 L-rhamnose mutarotase [Halomonas elongata]
MPIRALRMTLHPGQEAEYRRRHAAIWPELVTALREAGIEEYRIFLDPESRHLFAIMTLADDHRVDDLPSLPVMQRWWHAMADIMDTEPDASPQSVALDEVFTMLPEE